MKMKIYDEQSTTGQRIYAFIKILLFVGFFVAGVFIAESDFMIDRHERHHMSMARKEGLNPIRTGQRSVHVDRHTFWTLAAGFGGVMVELLILYWVAFIVLRSHYWPLGAVLGCLIKTWWVSVHSTDINSLAPRYVPALQRMFLHEFTWVIALSIIGLIIWKGIPEYMFFKHGSRNPMYRSYHGAHPSSSSPDYSSK